MDGNPFFMPATDSKVSLAAMPALIATTTPPTQQLPMINDSRNSNSEQKVGACKACRARKVKCPGPMETGKCPQCAKHGLECVFEAHRRGRKLGSKTKRRRSQRSGSSSTAGEDSVDESEQRLSRRPRTAAHQPLPAEDGLSVPERRILDITRNDPVSNKERDTQFDRELPHALGLLATVSSAIHAGMHEGVDPYRTFPGVTAPPHPASALVAALRGYAFHEILDVDKSRDVVDCKIVTLAEAETLFSYFYEKLSEPTLSIIDSNLHTVAYTRSRSSALFCIICYLSARHHPDYGQLVQPLQAKLHSLVKGPFLYNGRKSAELVAATILVHFFKRQSSLVATDLSWQTIGFAIRMATDVGLNQVINLPEDASLQERRIARFRERTWLMCWMADRAASDQTGRKWTMMEDELVMSTSRWCQSDLALPTDRVLHAMISLQRIRAGMIETMPISERSQVAALAPSYHHVINKMWTTELRRWQIEWLGDENTSTLHLGKLAPLFLMMPRLALLTRQIAITEGSERVRTGYECFAHAYSTLKGLMKVERDCFLYLVNSTFVTITYVTVICLRFRECATSLDTLYPFLDSVGDLLITAGETPAHKQGASTQYGRLVKQLIQLSKVRDETQSISSNYLAGDADKDQAAARSKQQQQRTAGQAHKGTDGEASPTITNHTPEQIPMHTPSTNGQTAAQSLPRQSLQRGFYPGEIKRTWFSDAGPVTGSGAIYNPHNADGSGAPPPPPPPPQAQPMQDFAFLAASQQPQRGPQVGAGGGAGGGKGALWFESMAAPVWPQDGAAGPGAADFGPFDRGMFDEMTRFACSFADPNLPIGSQGVQGNGVNAASGPTSASPSDGPAEASKATGSNVPPVPAGVASVGGGGGGSGGWVKQGALLDGASQFLAAMNNFIPSGNVGGQGGAASGPEPGANGAEWASMDPGQWTFF